MVTFIVYDNVKGPTLNIVGLGLFPDIYTMPFHSLNASLSSPFGEKKRNEIKIRVSNLLNDDALHTYKSFQANDEVFSKYLPGFSISIGLTFNL